MTRLMCNLGALLSRSMRISSRRFRESSEWAPCHRSLREWLARA